jgi:hypothetical protein
MKTEAEEFNEQLISIQKAYEQRRIQIQESISALEREHAEWMSLNDGQKLMRLKIVASLKKMDKLKVSIARGSSCWQNNLLPNSKRMLMRH